MVRKKDEQISELTQRMLQLNEDLKNIQHITDTNRQQMINAIQCLRLQLESKEKEIATLKGAVAPQSIYTHHPSTHGTILSAQNHPPQVTPTTNATASNQKVCPMCQVKFPANYSNSEFQAHVGSHFDY